MRFFQTKTKITKRTFKYHMTLKKGGRDLLKPSEYRHMGEGLTKSSYNFYSG